MHGLLYSKYHLEGWESRTFAFGLGFCHQNSEPDCCRHLVFKFHESPLQDFVSLEGWGAAVPSESSEMLYEEDQYFRSPADTALWNV